MGVLITVAVIGLALQIQAYSNGPHPSTCTTLFPKHGVEKQMGIAPYRLVLSNDTYTPGGQPITVRLESTVSGKTFKGFQVTAHRAAGSGNTQDFIGTFNSTESNTQSMTCLGQPLKMFAHSTNFSRRSSVVGAWTPPTENVGSVELLATVVENYTIIWYKISATLNKPAGNVTKPGNDLTPVAAMSTNPDWTQCGKTKGCFFVSKAGTTNCSGDDCKAAVAFKDTSGELVDFEMLVDGQENYISVAWSDDGTMTDDQIVSCTTNQGYESVQLGYNPKYYSDRQFSSPLKNLHTKQQDGKAYCSFSRPKALSSLKEDGSSRSFDIGTIPYYLFLAWGHIYTGTDVFGKHSETPAISKQKFVSTSKVLEVSAGGVTTSDNGNSALNVYGNPALIMALMSVLWHI